MDHHEDEGQPFEIEDLGVASSSHASSSKASLLGAKDWRLSIEDFQSKVKNKDEIKKLPKAASSYYKNQSALVSLFAETLGDGHISEEQRDKAGARAKIAIYGSFAVNVFLCIAKIYASIVSGSLAVIASAIDSVLDLLSGSIIFITSFAMQKTNPYKYPAGKARLEPLGVIIFSACMFTAALQLLVEGIQVVLAGGHKIEIAPPTLAIIGTTIGSKIFLFLYCRLQTSSPSALALAQDHQNDVLTNTVGLGCALLAFYFPIAWFLDPIAGMLMGIYIMITWFKNGYEQVKILSGMSADKAFLSKVTFLCWNHHPQVIAIDTVRAFHLASGYMVEIDIVLPANLPLHDAHDIGETLQIKLESWDEVERCFVHLDYETAHKPEHKWIGGKAEKH